MKQRLCIILVMFLFIFCSNSIKSQVFTKMYYDNTPYPISNFCGKIVRMNNNYYLLGSSGINYTSYGSKYWNILVIKTDTNGNLLAEKNIGGIKQDNPSSIITMDSSLLISGKSNSFSSGTDDCILIKLDNNLNVKWFKSIGGPDIEAEAFLAKSSRKSIYLTSSTLSFGLGSSGSGPDIYLIKFDNDGNFVWSRTIGNVLSDAAFDIKVNSDDKIIMVGLTAMPLYYKTNPYLVILDSSGNVLKLLMYNMNVLDTNYYVSASFRRFSFLSPNEIISVGYYYKGTGAIIVDRGVFAMKINLNTGNVIKSKFWKVKNSNASYFFYTPSLFITNNQRVYVLSDFQFSTSWGWEKKQVISILDTSLSIYSTKIINSSFKTIADASGINIPIDIEADNNYLLIGGGNKYNTPTYKNIKMIFTKTDTLINNCNVDTLSVAEDTITYTVIPTGSITSVNQGTVLSWTPTVVEGGVDSTICFCPALPVTVQTSPVNCFANGSATLLPSPAGNYVYQWSPPVSNTNTAANLPAGTYSVTIFDSLGCRHLSIVTITTNLSFPLSVSGNTFVCSPDAATLVASGASSYTWSTGSNDSSIVVYPATSTIYTLTASAGVCTQTVAVTVSVNPTPTLLLSMSSATIGIGDTLHLSLYGGNQYSFSPSENVYLQNNILSLYPRESITYCIRGEKDGCYDTVCVFVKVDGSCFDNELPNVFTPNGDGVNDEWRVRWRCPEMIKDFRMEIYDRWGVKMYESMQRDAGWDGRTTSGEAVPAGTYYYVIEFSMNGKKQELKGYITLLR